MTNATDKTRPEPRAGILDIEAYVPGKSAAPAGVAKVYKLSSNENPARRLAGGDRGGAQGGRPARILSGRLGHAGCARRSARRTA